MFAGRKAVGVEFCRRCCCCRGRSPFGLLEFLELIELGKLSGSIFVQESPEEFVVGFGFVVDMGEPFWSETDTRSLSEQRLSFS